MLATLRRWGAAAFRKPKAPPLPAQDAAPALPSDPPATGGPQLFPVEKTFCVLAWNHLQIAPNGSVKMCCNANEDLHDKGRPLSVYVDRYEDIWNSDYMRNARRGMAQGERIAPCSRCFHEEDTVGVSRRTLHNPLWAYEGHAGFIESAKANDWRVSDRPGFLQLNMGNLCNLACRMCGGLYSSRIASDPVHDRWVPDLSPHPARWKGDRLRLAPQPVAGIEATGFHAYEPKPGNGQRWTAGSAVLEFPLTQDVRPERLELDIATAEMADRTVRILVNDAELYRGEIAERTNLSLEIARFNNQPHLRIELRSGCVAVAGRDLGVAVYDISLVGRPPGVAKANVRVMTRFSENSGWWGQPSLMFDEILGQPSAIRYLVLQGGEPLLIPETEDILDYLIEQGCAETVTLEIVSNMTILKPSVLDKLKRFRLVELGGSIDGLGEVLEYIRHPAKWRDIETNLRMAAAAPNIRIQFNTAVQAYNLLDVPNLLAYCNHHGYQVSMNFLVAPHQLSVLVMPPSVRDVAAQRVRELCATDLSQNVRAAAESVLHFLQQHRDTHRPELMRQFMLFTNDLDRSRGQNLGTTLPELYEHIISSGFEWTTETVHWHEA
jgi:MoaA/NifB/PqqE/SkfB family radical SAM enzyme